MDEFSSFAEGSVDASAKAPTAIVATGFQLGEPDASVIQDVLARRTERPGGLRFTWSTDRGFGMLSVPKRIDLTDEQLVHWAETKYGVSFEKDSQGMTPEAYREWILSEARAQFEVDEVGGIGVAARSWADVKESYPAIVEHLEKATGKVVFLGNGLSSLPLELLARRSLPEPPVVIDLLDMPQVLSDLVDLQTTMHKAGLPYPFEKQLKTAWELLAAADRGEVILRRHFVGSGAPPKEALSAEYVMNIFGPPNSTLSEQLSLVKPGGKLLKV